MLNLNTVLERLVLNQANSKIPDLWYIFGKQSLVMNIEFQAFSIFFFPLRSKLDVVLNL